MYSWTPRAGRQGVRRILQTVTIRRPPVVCTLRAVDTMSLIERTTLSLLRLESRARRLLSSPDRTVVGMVAEIFPRYKESVTLHADFYAAFLSYVELRLAHGVDTADSVVSSQLLSLLRSVGQEAKGLPELFQIATKVVVDEEGSLLFQNPLYTDGVDIAAWWDRHITVDAPDRRSRVRFARERDQIISSLFPALTHPILSYRTSTEGILESEGFVQATITVTKGIHDVCPEFAIGQEVSAYLGPPIGTVSPKSIVHNDGRTSILWLSRLALIGESWVIIQDGRFSNYEDTDLLKFLAMGVHDAPRLSVFRREQQLMESLAFFESAFAGTHASLIFDKLIEATGKPFGTEAVAGAVDAMHADLSPSLTYLLTIFAWEYERCIEDPRLANGLRKRLQSFAGEKHVLHHLATDTTLSATACIQLYMSTFSDLQSSQAPETRLERFEKQTLAFYPQFSVNVDLSLLDCGVGSVIGMIHPSSLPQLESMIGTLSAQHLLSIDGRSITDRAEFVRIATALHKDPKRFSRLGHCENPHCAAAGKENFLGECGWCLSCELKDDLGLSGSLAALSRDTAIAENGVEGVDYNVDRLTLDLFIQSTIFGANALKAA